MRNIALGDLDGDGVLDVVVTHHFIDEVSVFMGVGDGTFGIEQQYSVGVSPLDIKLGDLDADGDLDAVVACSGDDDNYLGDVSILRNNGDGTFAARVGYDVEYEPQSITLGDADGDGDLDIAVAVGLRFMQYGDVAMLLNAGDGSFTLTNRFEAGASVDDVAFGDLNGDGALDLVASNWLLSSPQYYQHSVTVLLNTGDATCAADLTGDGELDFFDVSAFLNAFNAGDLSVDITGDGTLDFFDVSAFLSVFNAGCP